MTSPDIEFDPDDNFANGFFASGMEEPDDDATVEALVWQLLLLINPADEDAALQQFTAWQEASAEDEGAEPLDLLKDIIDWKAGFHVADDDVATFIDAIAELTARWNLRVDWGVEDPTDDDFLARTDVGALVAVAFDRLREHGYTLWTWDTGTDATAGWITLARDDEGMRVVAAALAIEVRTGAG
ncbi:DUF6630 family protein [Cognatiluteimonas profundi]|uniref:DUF6630 family protein n=1 Tax=Cognatiluteimonas profundi TaxID=2594501 RepID=UPI003CCD41CE